MQEYNTIFHGYCEEATDVSATLSDDDDEIQHKPLNPDQRNFSSHVGYRTDPTKLNDMFDIFISSLNVINNIRNFSGPQSQTTPSIPNNKNNTKYLYQFYNKKV
ncbi:hypothetical protein CHS0354_017419 [Potamilus streckersoni]|uniref:Uncharacterized protein n=1 Tax=Potamilus streckersoni TaxID=2493646 RepID=A0AAE0WAT2_9BIVA|nr:hypothetical protein CHS0354_017419 [Potamilus streckersoni]